MAKMSRTKTTTSTTTPPLTLNQQVENRIGRMHVIKVLVAKAGKHLLQNLIKELAKNELARQKRNDNL
jgi:hypothetical protein